MGLDLEGFVAKRDVLLKMETFLENAELTPACRTPPPVLRACTKMLLQEGRACKCSKMMEHVYSTVDS